MSAITSTSNSGSTTKPASSTNSLDALSSQDFLKVMLTELSKQDPLAPSDTKEILQQVGTIRSIESNLTLTNDLTKLVSQNKTASASGLIGKYVSGLSDTSDKAEGIVSSVSVTKDGPILNLANGKRVPIDNVENIVDIDVLKQLTTPAPAAGSN